MMSPKIQDTSALTPRNGRARGERSVRFTTSLPLLHEYVIPSKSSNWFSRSDYADFKATARMIARELRSYRYNTQFLEDSYQRARHMSDTKKADERCEERNGTECGVVSN